MRASLLILYLTSSIDAFSISIPKHPTCHIDVETQPMGVGVGCCTTTTPRPQTRVYSRLLCAISSSSEASSATKGVIPTGESYSTLTLLEHMHLLTPNAHNDIVNSNDSKGSNMIDLFVNTLGFGLDPKSVDNINKKSGMFFKSDSPFLANDMKYHICILLSYMYILSIKSSGVVFVNCGASQLHLNDDIDYCQKMEMLQKDIIKEGDSTHPTYEIGLRYNSLSLLKEELSKVDKNLCKYTIIDERGERETIRITDPYGRIFIARKAINDNVGNENATDEPSISSICTKTMVERQWIKLLPSMNSSLMHPQQLHMMERLTLQSSALVKLMKMAGLNNPCYLERGSVSLAPLLIMMKLARDIILRYT